MRAVVMIAAIVSVLGMSNLTAQIYRPVQGIGLPETHREGSEITLPGVADLEGKDHSAAPQTQPSAPSNVDTSVWPALKEMLIGTWSWLTNATVSVWESLTWWW